MKNTLIAAMFAIGLVIAGQAFAMDLAQARAQGIVGEKLDGYVGAVGSSATGQTMADDVNTKRRAEYEKISKQNSQPVAVVAKVAAETIINGLPSGSMYQAPDGSWKRK